MVTSLSKFVLTVMATKHLIDFSKTLYTVSLTLKIGILVSDQNRWNHLKMTTVLKIY